MFTYGPGCTFFIPLLPYLNKNGKQVLSSELFGEKKKMLPSEAEVHESTYVQE